MVAALSNAETPVVVPRVASTETVKAVVKRDVLSRTIIGSPSSSSRCSVRGMHTSPRPCVTMKFTDSGVAISAATMRSPSFSRSSSSTRITGLPSRKS